MKYELQWVWFSQAGGRPDIYLTTMAKHGKEMKEVILANFNDRYFAQAQAERAEVEIERIGLKMESRTLKEMVSIYNKERAKDQYGATPDRANGVAGIFPAKIRNGWKKNTVQDGDLPSKIREELGIEF